MSSDEYREQTKLPQLIMPRRFRRGVHLFHPELEIYPMVQFGKMMAVGLLLTGAALACRADEGKLMQPIAGDIHAPPTQFGDGNHSTSLPAFRGKFVLVNFWATWCSPCIKEMPALDRLAARLKQKGLVVVAISQDEGGPVQVRPFAKKLNLSQVQILYDPEKRGFRDFALRGLPTTVLISPEGILLARLEGSAVWDEGILASQVETLVTTDLK